MPPKRKTKDQSDPSDPTDPTDLRKYKTTRPLCESGDRHPAGALITLTPERAAALGNLVEPA